MNQLQRYKIQSQDDHIQNLQLDHILSQNLKIQKKKIAMIGKNIGHWIPSEKLLYLNFLKQHRLNFVKKQLRRTDKIFKEMSKYIETRAADQCRSHHQKMERKYGPIDCVIAELQQDYNIQSMVQQQKIPMIPAIKQAVSHDNSGETRTSKKLQKGVSEQNIYVSMNLSNDTDEIELRSGSFEFMDEKDMDNHPFEHDEYFGF